jgi:hypothetical protein
MGRQQLRLARVPITANSEAANIGRGIKMAFAFTIRRVGLALAASLALAGSAVAQAYDGDWTGALQAGPQKLRLVLHVKTAAGATTAALDSLDQDVTLDATAVKTEGGQLSALFLQAGGELKAKLAADGQSLGGTWEQNGVSLPLTLTKQPAAK